MSLFEPTLFTTLSILFSSIFIHLNLATPQKAHSKAKKDKTKIDPRKDCPSIKPEQKAGFADLPLCRTFYILHLHDPSKPLVVFLHGFTASTQSYKPIMQRLGGSEINFLSFDFISHGKSEMLPFVSNELFTKQLDQLLHHVFGSNIPSLILVGHSQAGTFAPRYALENVSRIKSVILITPGGIDFKWRDYLHNPLYILVRNLYLAGCNKFTQDFAIRISGFTISFFRRFFWPFSKPLFFTFIPIVPGLSDSLHQIFQEYWHLIDDWLLNMTGHLEHPEKRANFLKMITSMLDNLDLLRDNTAIFKSLAKTGIPIELILARYDPVVTIQAGYRLFYTMNPNSESEMVQSFIYNSPDSHHMRFLDSPEYNSDEEVLSDDSSLYWHSPNVNLHILKATHLVPVEAPGKLCQIVLDSYLNAILKF